MNGVDAGTPIRKKRRAKRAESDAPQAGRDGRHPEKE
jgi:hypothetical protein